MFTNYIVYIYRLHDFDNNTMLDGLEIFKALTHLMPYEDMDPIGDQVDVTGKSSDQIKAEKKALRIRYYTGNKYSIVRQFLLQIHALIVTLLPCSLVC